MSEKSAEKPKKKSERILAFDLLRGYFLAVILFNHLQFYPSGLDFLTGRGILYVSTAEGFFVVSGIVLGIVRGRKLLDQPFKVAARLLWKRSFQLYITSIILTLLFTVIGQFFLDNPGLKSGIYTGWANWPQLLWETFTLHYTYGWADFLRLYAIFIFFAPVALWLLRKGMWYVVALVSFALWTLYPLLESDTMVARPFSWQFIFFLGFIIGFYWQSIVAKWRSLSLTVRKTIGWSLASLFAITAIASAVLVFGHKFSGTLGVSLDSLHHIIEQGYNKDRLPIPRLLLGTVWFWGLFYIVRRFESKIVKYAGTFLLNFGMNSLYVYTISAFVVFFTHLIIAPPGLGNPLLNLLVSLLALGIVYLSLRSKTLMKIIPR